MTRRAALLLLFFGSTLAAAAAPRAALAEPDYGKTPVLFVHGRGLSSETWHPMMYALNERGYPDEYLFGVDLEPSDGGNERAATEQIVPAIEGLLAKAAEAATVAGYEGRSPQRVDIVAHSMGAFSSRWYVARIRPERVRTWISIAGANHGTDAVCGLKAECDGEMCPAFASSGAQSLLQIALNGSPTEPLDETPYGLGPDPRDVPRVPPDADRAVLYYTIRIPKDEWIRPAHSATLEGAGGPRVRLPRGLPVAETSRGNYLFTGSAWHDELAQAADVILLVAQLLSVRDEPAGKP